VERVREVLPFEAREPGVQRHERRPGLLGLQGAQPLDGLGDRLLLAREEHLPRQRGPVELFDAELLHRDAKRSLDGLAAACSYLPKRRA
jgi:hypothetical protein